jgi:hypothetical protein
MDMKAQSVVAKVSGLEGPSNKTSKLSKEGRALLSDEGTGAGSSTAKQSHVKESSLLEISSSTPTLAGLHSKLTPENKKLWYRRTGGAGGAEGTRVAAEILASQGAA